MWKQFFVHICLLHSVDWVAADPCKNGQCKAGLEIRWESENPFLQRFSPGDFMRIQKILVKIVRYIDYECPRIQRFSQRFSPNIFARIHLDSCSMSQISSPARHPSDTHHNHSASEMRLINILGVLEDKITKLHPGWNMFSGRHKKTTQSKVILFSWTNGFLYTHESQLF